MRQGINPSTGWGSVNAGHVGEVTEICGDGIKCVVKFQHCSGWVGVMSEMEVVLGGDNNEGQESSALHIACSHGHPDIVRVLIQRGASINMKAKVRGARSISYVSPRGMSVSHVKMIFLSSQCQMQTAGNWLHATARCCGFGEVRCPKGPHCVQDSG